MNDPRTTDVDRIAADPTDIPGPIDRSSSPTVEVELETAEVVAEVEPGVNHTYMTFDEQVPGPMIRVRQGDTVEMTVTNREGNSMPHNVDLHAVRGPGGGGEASLVSPAETKSFRFEATDPGAFIYHCAVPQLDYHISRGMFGLILVEPPEGLPEVDHEFYFGQNELYTTGDADEEGHHDFDFEAMTAENPTYVLMNGEKYAITGEGYSRHRRRGRHGPRVLRHRRTQPHLPVPPDRLRLGRGLATGRHRQRSPPDHPDDARDAGLLYHRHDSLRGARPGETGRPRTHAGRPQGLHGRHRGRGRGPARGLRPGPGLTPLRDDGPAGSGNRWTTREDRLIAESGRSRWNDRPF